MCRRWVPGFSPIHAAWRLVEFREDALESRVEEQWREVQQCSPGPWREVLPAGRLERVQPAAGKISMRPIGKPG